MNFGQYLAESKMFYLFDQKYTVSDIEHIYCDSKHKVTVVIFKDGSKSICRCSKDDIYNEYAGICICIAKHIYGKSYLEKIIQKKLITKK